VYFSVEFYKQAIFCSLDDLVGTRSSLTEVETTLCDFELTEEIHMGTTESGPLAKESFVYVFTFAQKIRL